VLIFHDLHLKLATIAPAKLWRNLPLSGFEALDPIWGQMTLVRHNLAFPHQLHSLWMSGTWRVPMQIVTRFPVAEILMLAASVFCIVAITFVI
jgi:hypothetical protein